MAMRLVCAALGCAALISPSVASGQATIVPTTVNDEFDVGLPNGSCSLREAIETANTGADVDDCTADTLSPPYTIELGSGAVYVRALADAFGDEDLNATGDLDIESAVVLRTEPGALAGAVIQGSLLEAGGRVLDVGPTGELELVDVTVRYGVGGIESSGPLTLERVTVSRNLGTGLSLGTGATAVTNSTISLNRSPVGHGGIHTTAGPLTLKNTTVAGNSGPLGGGIVADGPGSVTLDNTIVSGNTDTDATVVSPDCSGALTSGGHNLIKSVTGCPGFATPTDITGVSARLAPLASRGGLTQTQGLYPDSPALGRGNPAGPDGLGANCATTDQRGTPRPVGTRCDIGAFEGQVRYPPRPGVFCNGQRATIAGTARGERLRGTPKRDVIAGLGGNDVILGVGGNDILCGGPGRDRILGGAGADRAAGNRGDDRIRGGRGPDKLFGGAGRDRLWGDAGRDRLIGGPGNDRLRGGAGADHVRGGPGRDDEKK